jgi:hypothetical protein
MLIVAKSLGRTIAGTPSVAWAALMSASAALMQALLEGSVEHDVSVSRLSDRLPTGSPVIADALAGTTTLRSTTRPVRGTLRSRGTTSVIGRRGVRHDGGGVARQKAQNR